MRLRASDHHALPGDELVFSCEGAHAEIHFALPQWAVTPGQSVVVYESNVCLGGGIITGGNQLAVESGS